MPESAPPGTALHGPSTTALHGPPHSTTAVVQESNNPPTHPPHPTPPHPHPPTRTPHPTPTHPPTRDVHDMVHAPREMASTCRRRCRSWRPSASTPSTAGRVSTRGARTPSSSAHAGTGGRGAGTGGRGNALARRAACQRSGAHTITGTAAARNAPAPRSTRAKPPLEPRHERHARAAVPATAAQTQASPAADPPRHDSRCDRGPVAVGTKPVGPAAVGVRRGTKGCVVPDVHDTPDALVVLAVAGRMDGTSASAVTSCLAYASSPATTGASAAQAARHASGGPSCCEVAPGRAATAAISVAHVLRLRTTAAASSGGAVRRARVAPWTADARDSKGTGSWGAAGTSPSLATSLPSGAPSGATGHGHITVTVSCVEGGGREGVGTTTVSSGACSGPGQRVPHPSDASAAPSRG